LRHQSPRRHRREKLAMSMPASRGLQQKMKRGASTLSLSKATVGETQVTDARPKEFSARLVRIRESRGRSSSSSRTCSGSSALSRTCAVSTHKHRNPYTHRDLFLVSWAVDCRHPGLLCVCDLGRNRTEAKHDSAANEKSEQEPCRVEPRAVGSGMAAAAISSSESEGVGGAVLIVIDGKPPERSSSSSSWSGKLASSSPPSSSSSSRKGNALDLTSGRNGRRSTLSNAAERKSRPAILGIGRVGSSRIVGIRQRFSSSSSMLECQRSKGWSLWDFHHRFRAMEHLPVSC
jgi:hypothetical protein